MWTQPSPWPGDTKISANAYETVGHERVMFGIDSPFHHPTVEIQKVMACGVDDEGLENIFYNNAAKFMGLK